jgi:hypothetical protein
MFAAVRHPDVAALGIIPAAALDLHRVHGWYRVSPWAPEPADLHLPDYAEAFEDLDAEPEPPKKSRPAKPAPDEEQEA